MIWLVLYLYALLCISNWMVTINMPHPRKGWDLAWRIALAPILLPLFVITSLVKGR